MHRPEAWLDVRYGLPFKNDTVSLVYASHFFEHFYLRELRPLLKECYRVLEKGGALRIAVPNLASAIRAYCSGQHEWFSGFPQNFSTLGGRFVVDMLCEDQHRLMFDFDFLCELLAECGFETIEETHRGESRLTKLDDVVRRHELDGIGKEPDPWLLVDAIK